MALSRFLLLCLLAYEAWDAETKPIDFVCSRSARRAMNIVSEIQTAMHQEKRQEISASLRLLMEGVKAARHPSQAECSLVLLQRLEHNINSYLLILTHLQLGDQQRSVDGAELSCVPESSLSLSTVLLNYNRLITGKLERLMISLESRCTSQ
uniref:thrombopoietin isoform X2 n=1 Tax=Doryrhamphus excisus TaxID=161450 RepID=UPI0025ADE972|nr:thrombopoietin isoform X2 [Doryrhamphus excisus]